MFVLYWFCPRKGNMKVSEALTLMLAFATFVLLLLSFIANHLV